MTGGRRASGIVAALVAGLLAAACGFHMRGQATLPFATLHVEGSTPLAVELKRNLAAGTRTRLVDSAKNAEATLGFTRELREKVILSLDSAGRVREFQLRYRVGFRLTDAKGRDTIPVNEIMLTRDVSFDDAQILAKESEETLLYRDMQSDLVQQIVRRLAAAKPPPAE